MIKKWLRVVFSTCLFVEWFLQMCPNCLTNICWFDPSRWFGANKTLQVKEAQICLQTKTGLSFQRALVTAAIINEQETKLKTRKSAGRKDSSTNLPVKAPISIATLE